MKNIIVVEAISTGYNYPEDIYRRGYNPIVLEPISDFEDMTEMRRECYDSFYREVEVIKEQSTYEETLELVRTYDPILIVPGSESGVVLATHLAYDLGLPGNSWENIDKMTKKDAMQEALKAAGIRYIKGELVKSPEEAVEFCKKNGFENAVVKTPHGAGSSGLYLCNNISEVEAAVKELLTTKDYFGDKNNVVLVQERIVGTEYIVNTVSCEGAHRVTSILRYKKHATEEGGYIYDYMENIMRLEPGHSAMVEYALKVADAIGIRYGMVHGEYMIDKKGPVLIEVNCRPMGCAQPAEYLDSIFGQHESDSALDSYLDPVSFKKKAVKPYRPLRKEVLKFIMVPEDMDVEDHPLWEIAKRLRSTYKITAETEIIPKQYTKTRDMDNMGGEIYMVHDDENIVMSDLSMLRNTEKHYFQMLLNSGASRRWFKNENKSRADFDEVIKRNECCGSILIAKDTPEHIEGMQVVTPDTLSDAHVGFDNVIIGYQESLLSLSETQLLKLIFDTMNLVREGGRVIIPPETYQYFSYGREGAEFMLSICRFMIELPHQNDAGDVVGTK